MIGKTVVAVSEDFYRPTDVVNLWGDPTKAKAKLKWNPNKTSFEELVKIMVEHDIAKVAAEGAAAKVRTNLAEYLEKGIERQEERLHPPHIGGGLGEGGCFFASFFAPKKVRSNNVR